MSDAGLSGRVGFLTGAGQGIGKAAALALAEAGVALGVLDLNAGNARRTAEEIQSAGGRALALAGDVSVEADVEAAVAAVVEEFGRLDLAFNNAGITAPPSATHDADAGDFDRVIAVNVRGTWLCMKHELPAMLAAGTGTIVNMASMWAHVGFAESTPAYVAGKHAVLGLTRTAALEYAARGIRVNAVSPGVIHTEGLERRLARIPDGEATLSAWAPMNRMGAAKEVAEAVIWLCSDASSFVTGQAVPVDGGYLAR